MFKIESKSGQLGKNRRNDAILPGPTVDRVQASTGGGRPLNRSVRNFFEPRFGYDFSRVRVRSDETASRSAREIGAHAYTLENQIVFDVDHYRPQTRDGLKLLAHELTHVMQQGGMQSPTLRGRAVRRPRNDNRLLEIGFRNSGPRRKASSPRIQRQTLPIPEFDELDPCLIVPDGLPAPFDGLNGQKVCGSHAKKLRELITGKDKRNKKNIECPPGFMPGAMSGYEDKCCKITGEMQEGRSKSPTTTHNERNCCIPTQIMSSYLQSRCCPAGTMPNAARDACEKTPQHVVDICRPDIETSISLCVCAPPSRQNLLKGTCCPVGQIPNIDGTCAVEKSEKKKQNQVADVKPFILGIHFKRDRPTQTDTGEAELNDSLIGDGQANLQQLIEQLMQNSALSVQLEGHASPEGTEVYNMQLSQRRAGIIAVALQRAGIDRARIRNSPDHAPPAECNVFGNGLTSCGEMGASGPEDRKVKAVVFSSSP